MNHFRVNTRYKSEQNPDLAQKFPFVLTTGRMVEHMGGGAETRSNKYLAELQPEMYAEVNPVTGNNLGVRDGDMIWIESPEGGKVKVSVASTEGDMKRPERELVVELVSDDGVVRASGDEAKGVVIE